MEKIKKASKKLNMRTTLLLFAVIPLLISTLAVGVILANSSSSALEKATLNSMLSLIKQTGAAFDYTTARNEDVMLSFQQAPVIKEFLKNPDNAELAKKAQEYTVNYYGKLAGWEGIYLADWNSKVLTHPAPPVVGRVMREGDRLEELRNAMLASDGVYNVGIIESPASGQLIMSMYAPIFDDNGTPIGYVGGGTFINAIAASFSDVSSLQMKSAYIYFVNKEGTMLHHPDESKIGNAVENAAVKGLVARLANGETVEPGYVEYEYKGAMKYASYFVGENDAYIAVLTADKADVMATVNHMGIVTVVVCLISILLFSILAVVLSNTVSKPLTVIVNATKTLSTGDVTAECNTTASIQETANVIDAFHNLKDTLQSSISEVKESADALNTAIISVDEKTANNVESVSQISIAIDEVANTSQAVASSAQDMAGKAAELDVNIGTLNSNVVKLHDASMAIRSANDEATKCMESVYAGSIESVDAVQAINEKISETNNAISNISSAVAAIESIAAQTNLLSLNASIEAARAGEAGRGFAVVADEIRTLADSSASSAQEISQIIENVIALSNSTVEISNKVFEVIKKEQADIQTTQEKFNVLSDSVEASIAGIDTIKKMSEELDEIKIELTNATSDLGAISEELGASAQEVAASCQTVMEACTDTQSSTQEMRAINDSMASAIDFFKLS